MPSRAGEPDKTHFRSKRIETINGKWFFKVREQEEIIGPYSSAQSAQAAIERYVGKPGSFKPSRLETLAERYIEHEFFQR